MSFAAPWALLGLASLPVLWWLHVRRKKPPLVDTSSLMFVLDEEEQTKLPRGRRFDWELFLTLATAALLTLAAAGPRWSRERPQRVVRVVVAGGALAWRTGYGERVDQTLDAMSDAIAAGDRLDVIWVPRREEMGAPRPSLDRLLGEARAGDATVRYVISDRLPQEAPMDIAWVALGGPGENAGIVSARVFQKDGKPHLFVVVERTNADWEGDLRAGSTDVFSLQPAGDTVLTATVPLPDGDAAFRLDVSPKGDANPADDTLVLSPARVPVFVDPGLPSELQRALAAALDAMRMAARRVPAEQARVVFGASSRDTPFVVDFAVPTRAPTVRLPDGDDVVSSSSFVRDLSLDGTSWRFAAVPSPVDDDELLLGRVVDGRVWPILVRSGNDAIRMLALPPAADAPFWPIFVENVLDTVAGADAGSGYRVQGVLDRSVTMLGRDRQPFNAATLRAVPPDRMPATLGLRTPCLVFALLGVLALWALPFVRQRRTTASPAVAK